MTGDDFCRVYAAFGREIGLSGLEVDAYGAALLEIDGVRLHVLYMAEVCEVLLSARAARLPAQPPAPLLMWLLSESLEQIEKRGAAFAVDPDDHSLVVSRRLSTHRLEFRDLAREVETLVSLAETAAREIRDRAWTPEGRLPASEGLVGLGRI